MEDYEYFWLLRQAGEERLANDLCKKVINVALSEAAGAIPAQNPAKPNHRMASRKENREGENGAERASAGAG